MTQTLSQSQKLTFEAYLSYDDGTDNRYELIEGELVALPPESWLNTDITGYLFLVFARLVDFRLIKTYCCALQVTGKVENRYPDLVILSAEHPKLASQSISIRLDMSPPQLVVEVVSPGKANQQRDYIDKRQQYAARGIPEYWIVDPQDKVVIVLRLEAGKYVEVGRFQGNQRLISPTFPALELTAEQVLNPGA